MASFESTKSDIVSSGLGQAVGLTTSSTWAQLIEKIKSIVNHGAVNQELSAGGSYTILQGYHSGGKVTAKSLASQTDATATAAQILSGYTAWVKGNKITGAMTNQGAVSQTLNCGGSYTIPAGYHNGSGKVGANSLASQTDATAAAAQILSGYTAWVKGSKITGTMANKGNLNWSGSNTTYSVPAGYYSGGTLDSRPSYTNGYNAGVTAADNRVNTNSTNYKSGYSAGQTAKRDSITVSKVGPSDDDVTLNTYTFAATVGRCYVAAMGGDPGRFQQFTISGATILSNIYGGDTPPEGTEFVRMITFKATSTSVTIYWAGTSPGSTTPPRMIVGLIN